jgi:hypothetical protein
MGIIGQSDQQIAGVWFRFTVFEYSVSGETLVVDPTANSVAKVFHLEGGTAPTVAVAATTSTYSTVTITSGTLGRILVITMHGTTVGGVH